MNKIGPPQRPRGRMNNGRTHTKPRSHSQSHTSSNNANRVYDSQNCDGKLRGNAQQLVEKYTSMARDAAAFGDRVRSESFYQYADHYHRMFLASRPEPQPEPRPVPVDENSTDDRVVQTAPSPEQQEAPVSPLARSPERPPLRREHIRKEPMHQATPAEITPEIIPSLFDETPEASAPKPLRRRRITAPRDETSSSGEGN